MLPKHEIMALKLIDGESLTYEEAAQRTGVPVETLATYVANARASLVIAYESIEIKLREDAILYVDAL
jgi:DNA-directed RNA polymerase specialized sigma24 family protein